MASDLLSGPPSVLSIPGATYLPDFVDDAGERALLVRIDAMPWLGDLQRRVQHHGYRYDYKARRVLQSMRLGDLPDFLGELADRLVALGHFSARPDQAIVNEYQPGQGISKHIDCVPCFGETVASLSLGSSCEMELQHKETGEVQTVFLAARSLLVLSGEARHVWLHSIRGRKSDRSIPRRRRVSITFRTILVDDA